MANPNFTPTYSTNDIWRDTDMTRCLTDDIDAIDAVHASLPSTYAAKNHTHTGYATAEDVTAVRDALSSKANVNHTHTEYASTSHNHDSSYYKKSDVDSNLRRKPTGMLRIPILSLIMPLVVQRLIRTHSQK